MHGYKSVLFVIAIFIISIAAPHATIASESLERLAIETRYDGEFIGIPLGRLRVTLDEKANTYYLRVDTKAEGIASIFSSIKSITEATGIITNNRQYIPQHYTFVKGKDSKKPVLSQQISYDKAGAIIEQIRNPPDDINWRPRVPVADANLSTDPLSAFFILRLKLSKMLENKQQTSELRTYDGARLATIQFTLMDRMQIMIADKPTNVIKTRIERIPIAGYTPKEWKKFRDGDPEINVYFSDDARLLPLLFIITMPLGDLTIELTKIKLLPTK